MGSLFCACTYTHARVCRQVEPRERAGGAHGCGLPGAGREPGKPAAKHRPRDAHEGCASLVAAQRSPSPLTTSTQLAAASSAAPGGLANEILIPRRKRLTPLISHRVKPNPNTRRGAGGRPWQRWGQGAAAAAHPAGAPHPAPGDGSCLRRIRRAGGYVIFTRCHSYRDHYKIKAEPCGRNGSVSSSYLSERVAGPAVLPTPGGRWSPAAAMELRASVLRTGASPSRGAGPAARAPGSPGSTAPGAAGTSTAPRCWQPRWARPGRTKAG